MMRKSRCNGSSEASSKREGRTVSRNTGLAGQGLAVSLNKLYSFAEPSPTKCSNTEKIIFPFCQQAVMVCHQCIYIFREGYSRLCWEPSSLWVFMHEDQKVSVLLPDRFANKLKRKRAHHMNDILPLTGKQWTPLVRGTEDSPDVTRCAQLCN